MAGEEKRIKIRQEISAIQHVEHLLNASVYIHRSKRICVLRVYLQVRHVKNLCIYSQKKNWTILQRLYR